MTDLTIEQGDPTQPDVVRLLQSHLDYAREWSLPENVRVLDATRLSDEGVRFFTARNEGKLVGIGALSPFEDRHAEIKSMHTIEEARERGVGWALLERLLGTAIEQECRRVSLETGTSEAFASARRLYARAGFKTCPPFGEYRRCPDSICMTRRLPAS
ncbi:MAG: GNAT family N-acetyltransferase [Phycisphaera sp.]|nr:GNAT family N-acetyltransferase [Phycisphaera sp.]